MKNFADMVYNIVRHIPAGSVITYRDVARSAGNSRAVRAVGNILNKNSSIGVVPCHRVVKSDGKIGGYVLGVRKKAALLRREGVAIDNEKVDLGKYRWKRLKKIESRK